ncbi:type ISP restriction/modification enzyme [Nitrospira moscoviensis]|uniref:site-specific DNA-methyltransferase (adenine-specific) n=1 Tax=Nitrospira moscoviensis TaxID=42253 RepID=A0A0K2GER6_NITMO|nr:type ISP restriction/modification enzyme [Nitrospira moscoviensis]ALA59440.1 Adenine specific DNA methyltransferase [Nitrospira moscoviensis]
MADPGQLEALNLTEVLDWAQAALHRVDRASFDKFQEGHAVQYFYEPFLQAYDPELRKELGVWYTPTEIVQYMVARVDTVLQEELGIEDGLADPRVYVLDPCCGTGAYLVEVLRRIGERLKDKGGDALVANDLKRAAMERVFGFEILPAPFVVSHLQLGLLLQLLGAPLSEKKSERIRVYLTNALTGWDPPEGPKTHLLFPELEEERDAAEKVKRETPILVILGNPPYNSFAGVAVAEERELTTAYRTTKRAPPPQGQGLNDLYIRFFRMAERRIVERTAKGIVCFISNYSWLDGLSFTGMRERYLEAFDHIWIDCLNGDKYKTGKLTPDGKPDPSVFSTEMNPEGIQVGTAISLLVRKHTHKNAEAVAFRHFWGKTKRAELEEAAKNAEQRGHEDLLPVLEMGLPFIPSKSEATYFNWPSLQDLFPVSFPGVKTSRDDVVIDIDKERLVQRLSKYFDPNIGHEEMRRIAPGVMESTQRFKAAEVRDTLRKRGFLPEKIVRYCYRPFDVRWLYWEPETKLLDEKRSEYFPHVFNGNIWLSAGQRNRKEDFYQPQFTTLLADHHIVESNVAMFPAYLDEKTLASSLFSRKTQQKHVPNISDDAIHYLTAIKEKDSKPLFFHSLAILHAPLYRNENAGAVRQDWPRVPLPTAKSYLEKSSHLGELLAGLLDPETGVKGVTTGTIRKELKGLGSISRVGGGAINPNASELDLTAGWGHAGKGGVTMPGKGKLIEREYTGEERTAIKEGSAVLGLSLDDALSHLGSTTTDVYLKEIAFWRNIPINVWNYTIGGYEVIKKWLSYRERQLLHRSLTTEEARELTNIARRIAAILLLEPALNKNYQDVKQSPYAWSK